MVPCTVFYETHCNAILILSNHCGVSFPRNVHLFFIFVTVTTLNLFKLVISIRCLISILNWVSSVLWFLALS